MKNIIQIIILSAIILSSRIVYSQPEPITIQFVEVQPIWENLIFDTSFFEVGIQPDVNKYTVIDPHTAIRHGDDLFISSLGFNYNADLYGQILTKIDIPTGNKLWEVYNTYYNHGIQDYHNNIRITELGEIELVGMKRNGPYMNNDPVFSYWAIGGTYSNVIRKKYDFNSGIVLDILESYDSLMVVPTSTNHFVVVPDSLYIMVKHTGLQLDSTFLFGYEFYKINSHHQLEDTLPIHKIWYETNDKVDFLSFGQPPLLQQINDSIILGLIFQDKFGLKEDKAQLIWINIKDVNNIHVEKRENIGHLIPGKASNYWNFIFKSLDNYIVISQRYFSQTENNYTTYLTCLDANGQLVKVFDKIQVNNHLYQRINLMYSSNNLLYLSAIPSVTGRYGFDILHLTSLHGEFQMTHSLTSLIPDEDFTVNMDVCTIYDDNYLIIGGYTKKYGPVQNSAVKYYAFDVRDFGIYLNSSAIETVQTPRFQVFPNPSRGCFSLTGTDYIQDEIYMDVFDLSGKLLQTNQTVSQGEICLPDLFSNIVIIKLRTQWGKLLGSYKLILQH